jgi:hypothetical protein
MSEEQFPAYGGLEAPMDTSPRPFGEIPGLWLKITQMTEEFFAQEAPRASGSNTLIGIAIFAVISAIIAALSSLIGGGVQMAGMPAEYQDMFATGTTMGGLVMCSLCGGLFGTVVSFYLASGLVYLGSRILGGSGDFGTQTYLQSLFTVPIGIVTSILSLVYLVPVIGGCLGGLIGLALSIYAIILNVRALKVAHNLTTGKAIAAILIPGLIIGVIVACLLAGALVLLAPTIGEVFEDIVNNLQ